MSKANNHNDKNNVRNKAKFILTWYNLEKKKLRDSQKVLLLNKWISSCTEHEEYEMSNALLNEKRMLIRSMRIKKIGERSWIKKTLLIARIALRKYIRKLTNNK